MVEEYKKLYLMNQLSREDIEDLFSFGIINQAEREAILKDVVS